MHGKEIQKLPKMIAIPVSMLKFNLGWLRLTIVIVWWLFGGSSARSSANPVCFPHCRATNSSWCSLKPFPMVSVGKLSIFTFSHIDVVYQRQFIKKDQGSSTAAILVKQSLSVFFNIYSVQHVSKMKIFENSSLWAWLCTEDARTSLFFKCFLHIYKKATVYNMLRM